MYDKKSKLIYEIREMNKIVLETFVFDKQKVLDSPIDDLIIKKGKN